MHCGAGQLSLFDSPLPTGPDEVPAEIHALIARGALFVVNHSAGKDSQCMFLKLQALVPARQLLVVHAILPEVEWDGVIEHIRATIGDTPLVFAQAVKTFFEMVEHRQKFPDANNRQCTSDLKRGPIEKQIRHYLKAHPEYGGLIVNCMGMRAQESPSRSKLTVFKQNSGNSLAGREWFDWLPIHSLSEDEVFETIRATGQEAHWAYAAGMRRLSCRFCILASQADLKRAAELSPELYKRYVETEQRLGFTLSMSRKTLPEITGIAIDQEAA